MTLPSGLLSQVSRRPIGMNINHGDRRDHGEKSTENSVSSVVNDFRPPSLFRSHRRSSLRLVAMGLDGLFSQANEVGHAAVGNLRYLLAEIERPSRHGDAHGQWSVAVKLFGGGEQRRRSERFIKATGSRFR